MRLKKVYLLWVNNQELGGDYAEHIIAASLDKSVIEAGKIANEQWRDGKLSSTDGQYVFYSDIPFSDNKLEIKCFSMSISELQFSVEALDLIQ